MRRRMRWRWAPDERWTKKAAKWNPGLSTKHQTNRTVGRPKKRWEDEINEETKGNDIKNYDTWIKVAKKSKKLESNGNRLCSCSSEPPLSRCRMRYATDASNLTCVLGEVEFSFTCGESGAARFFSTRQGSTSTYCIMKMIDGDPRLVPREAQQL